MRILAVLTKMYFFITEIDITILPEFHQVEESNTTLTFNVFRDDDLRLERNVSVRVSIEVDNAEGLWAM